MPLEQVLRFPSPVAARSPAARSPIAQWEQMEGVALAEWQALVNVLVLAEVEQNVVFAVLRRLCLLGPESLVILDRDAVVIFGPVALLILGPDPPPPPAPPPAYNAWTPPHSTTGLMWEAHLTRDLPHYETRDTLRALTHMIESYQMSMSLQYVAVQYDVCHYMHHLVAFRVLC